MIAEHGDQGVQNYLSLVQVSRCDVEEYILCVQCYLSVVSCVTGIGYDCVCVVCASFWRKKKGLVNFSSETFGT